MRIALFVLLAFMSFVPAEVYLKGFSDAPDVFSGETVVHKYGTFTVAGVPVKGEVVELPEGFDALRSLKGRGRIVFQDKNSMGIRYQGKIILLKIIPGNRVLRLVLDAEALE